MSPRLSNILHARCCLFELTQSNRARPVDIHRSQSILGAPQASSHILQPIRPGFSVLSPRSRDPCRWRSTRSQGINGKAVYGSCRSFSCCLSLWYLFCEWMVLRNAVSFVRLLQLLRFLAQQEIFLCRVDDLEGAWVIKRHRFWRLALVCLGELEVS